VIGFSSRYVREPVARLFYTEAHDPAAAAFTTKSISHMSLTNPAR
jgi:hypothetical protein